jgi:hypothetical protein
MCVYIDDITQLQQHASAAHAVPEQQGACHGLYINDTLRPESAPVDWRKSYYRTYAWLLVNQLVRLKGAAPHGNRSQSQDEGAK